MRSHVAGTVDYYFSPMSPWTYLGHERFAGMAKKHGVQVEVKPVDYGRIFPLSGGLPLAKRAPQRQRYRLAELRRWQEAIGIPLTLQPKYFPYDTGLASRTIIAARDHGAERALGLAGAILRACWAEEKNMADEEALSSIVKAQGLDPARLLAAAKQPQTQQHYEQFTDEAIARDVFGAPTYVYRDELFWGQDRLEFLEKALTTSPRPSPP
jgi:2-hydroxychromene-2-carboxylate isomerase